MLLRSVEMAQRILSINRHFWKCQSSGTRAAFSESSCRCPCHGSVLQWRLVEGIDTNSPLQLSNHVHYFFFISCAHYCIFKSNKNNFLIFVKLSQHSVCLRNIFSFFSSFGEFFLFIFLSSAILELNCLINTFIIWF